MTDPSTVSADVPRGAHAETDTESHPGDVPAPRGGSDAGTVIGTIRPATGPGTAEDAPAADTPAGHQDAQGAQGAHPGEPAPADSAEAPVGAAHRRRTGRGRRVLTAFLVILLLATAGVAVYLYRTSQAWQERAEAYLAAGQDVGTELAARQAELAGVEAELEAVRAQLATAQDRIIELANEKAAAADDREAQRQIADYQERVTVAAGQVAFALDQCVQGQNQLIAFLETQIELAETGEALPPNQEAIDQVHELCEGAREANISLQSELAR